MMLLNEVALNSIEKEAANLLVDEVVERGVLVVDAVLVEPLVEPVVEVVYSKEERNCKGEEVQNLINSEKRNISILDHTYSRR